MEQVKIVDITPLREGKSAPDVDQALFKALQEDFFVGIRGYNPKFDEVGFQLRDIFVDVDRRTSESSIVKKHTPSSYPSSFSPIPQ
ncbi:MAG TPA: hypothetical protein VJI15_00250 [Candidatus Nanoarchaeia archaeon]|nr:hypothetical protein [Candidatus Nanoarchaeia archaeon]